MFEPIRTQNLGSLLMKLSQSNFNLRSPDCYLVRSYLIATVHENVRKKQGSKNLLLTCDVRLVPRVET